MTPWRELVEAPDAPPGFADWGAPCPSLHEAWSSCERADWMIWIAGRLVRSPREQRELIAAATFVLERRGLLRPIPPWPTRIELARRWASGSSEDSRAGLFAGWLSGCLTAPIMLIGAPRTRTLPLVAVVVVVTFIAVWPVTTILRKRAAARALLSFTFDDAIDAVLSTMRRQARDARRQKELADALRRCADEPGRLKLA